MSVLVHNKQMIIKKLLDYPVRDHVKVIQVEANSIPLSTIYHQLRFLKSKEYNHSVIDDSYKSKYKYLLFNIKLIHLLG